MVLCETARVLGCHESRNPWTSWIPRLCKAFEYWAGSWKGPLTASPGRQILDMQSSSGNRSGPAGQLRHLESETNSPTLKKLDLVRWMQQPSNLDEMGLKRLTRFLGVRPRQVCLFKWQKRVTRTEFWLCVDAGWQCRQHALQRTGRDCTQLQRRRVLWVGECDIAKYLACRAFSLTVDGSSMPMCGPPRTQTSETPRHSVPLGTSNGL